MKKLTADLLLIAMLASLMLFAAKVMLEAIAETQANLENHYEQVER
jgi:hypothetical protein